MNIFQNVEQIPKDKNTVLTVGTFDGVHTGHQILLNEVRNHSIKLSARSLVITFAPHPRIVLKPDEPFFLLTTIEEKTELIKKLGIQNLLIIDFNNDFSQIRFDDFIKNIIVDKIGISEFVIGYNHHFGKDREGNILQLTELSQKYEFSILNISEHLEYGNSVSSSKIRNLLENGDIQNSNLSLGRSYEIKGEVVVGKKLGRQLGYPTANIKTDDKNKLVPKVGVYFVTVTIDNKTYNGMMNIGHRPTVTNEKEIIPEVHILDFDEDIYGKIISVNFLERLRDEIKFDSIEKLILQLNADKKICKMKIIK